MKDFDKRRVRSFNDLKYEHGSVIYWMSRDQRVDDNWALLYARYLAEEYKAPLAVIFCLVPSYLDATLRQYDFMIRGLKQVEKKLKTLNVPFYLLMGEPKIEIPAFLKKQKAGVLVTDFNPLRINRQWKEEVNRAINVPSYEVDAHNIVPVRAVSDKMEYAAYTIRPKIQKLLPEFLVSIPPFKRYELEWQSKWPENDWNLTLKSLKVDKSVAPIDRFEPGEDAAIKMLDDFLAERLEEYDQLRNDPNADKQSDLSPYLHFGQISAQRVAREVLDRTPWSKSQEAFLEQLIVRRELSDNFCYYNPDYDSYDGFPEWARASLEQHKSDPREYTYSLKQFEKAETHDDLWNAAQDEMVYGGKMHGYMRMYWAKKILEWSNRPEEAMATAVYLNDKYELDGRDPNGYAGIAWSIGGVHDRPWFEREIFGKIRFMSYNGCKKKFNIEAYIEKVNVLKQRGGK